MNRGHEMSSLRSSQKWWINQWEKEQSSSANPRKPSTYHVNTIILHYTPYILHLPWFFWLQPRKRHALFPAYLRRSSMHPGHPRIRTKALHPHRASPNDPVKRTAEQVETTLVGPQKCGFIVGYQWYINGCSQWVFSMGYEQDWIYHDLSINMGY